MTHRKDVDAFVAIVSHRRPQNVADMYEKIDGGATWYVADEQDLRDYTTEVTKHDLENVEIKIASGLCHSRNEALKDAWKLNIPCVMLDDDLKKLKLATVLDAPSEALGKGQTLTKSTCDITFASTVELMRTRLKDTKNMIKLAGVAPTTNLFYFDPKKLINTASFIIASFIMVLPNELYFDEEFKTKEDYDYTLQHIQKYGGVLRNNDIFAEFAHYTNKGGVVQYRTAKIEQESIKRLQSKWGSAIRINKRRENEILLNVR